MGLPKRFLSGSVALEIGQPWSRSICCCHMVARVAAENSLVERLRMLGMSFRAVLLRKRTPGTRRCLRSYRIL